MNSWIEVSEERLVGNYRVIAEAVGADTDVMAVVKANAYGHGAEACAVALARAGAKWLAVASVSEGVRVRRALDAAGFGPTNSGPSTSLPAVASLRMTNSIGNAPQILVMCGFFPEDVAGILEHRLTPVVWTLEQVSSLAGTGLGVHVEVETGMGRQGVPLGSGLRELDGLLDVMTLSRLVVDGVCTHFCAAEVADSELTRGQRRKFEEAIATIRMHELRPTWVHAGSSSSVDNPPDEGRWLVDVAKNVGARAMVRCGIGLYGYCSPIEGEAEARIRGKLRPVMTWKTRVVDVRDVAAGETIGYNATFVAPGPMRVALLGVGYSDGLRRSLSSTNEKAGGWVMIGGQRAAILGRVSMNLTVVDVTAIESVEVGDEVVLLGDGVTADDHARLAGTISYEILCGARVG